MSQRRIRIGIDVGGTFTKAVAIDIKTGQIIGKSTIPTTHKAQKGVSEGIITALSTILAESKIEINEIELIAHSTTQAINALLESDTAKVGIIAMGVTPEKGNIIKRTTLNDAKYNSDQSLKTEHAFLDTAHLISESEVNQTISSLKEKGAQVIVATEAFGVDDPSNEMFVMKNAITHNIPATASHEISGIYGLEIRTLTAAINASVLPKTFEVANFVEEAIKNAGVHAPVMIMKGDGGVTSMDTFRTKPILTILSGPAASVAGALLYLKISNGIFVEVGGTSTNICIIKNGKPEIRYVTIKDHPTCIRSMDVRILGVAGGSMIKLKDKHVWKVGPRSAHIAGMRYSCFADSDVLKKGKIIHVKPKQNDADPYVAVQCEGETFAITNTCAANALGMIEKDDYSYANQNSAKIAMELLGREIGVTGPEAAMSVIQTASFEITKTVSKILKEFKMDKTKTQIIGGGGGASVLVPFVAKQLVIPYQKAEHAEVISSIGVASSMIQEELEHTIANPTPEQISEMHKKIHQIMIDRGAVPESIVINSEYIAEKSLLRVSATGNVEMDSADNAKNVFTLDEAKNRASDTMELSSDLVDLTFETDHYFVFTGHVSEKKLFSKKNRHHVLVLDRFGRQKLSIPNAKIFQGGKISILEELDDFLESRNNDIAPQVYLMNNLKLIDFSSLTSISHILNAVQGELDSSEKAAIIVEL
ncbi:hydantoinase/oxoprolinase family protein [Candidatus Nitrosotenuis cloacae]|uniref:N-methylhydantoinase n=1 Tax=Candidatus Nitrosotenuis cloacae TaxID=1603555 RepID=A0A3G1B309_9ARCH|nr:hydantoinase/oxoprolinase family protein [Candidatus Nitrosotenuis cloacae]AJZ75311.1 N-methylhydantoinase [Candidatus Nitrosotenuis cloacae]